MNINENIDNLIYENTLVQKTTFSTIISIIGKYSFLKFIRKAKWSGVKILDPNDKMQDSFQEKIREEFVVAMWSIGFTTIMNQVINTAFSDASQSQINKLHIKEAASILTYGFLVVVFNKIINKIKKERNGEPLTSNEAGIVATTVLGFTMYMFMQHIEIEGVPHSSFKNIILTTLIVFLIKTTYVNDLINKVKNMFNRGDDNPSNSKVEISM